jgi:methylation protein EvaC
MPIANGFLRADEFPNEYFFDLQVAFCENCGMVQLLEQPCREMMFHENYAYFSPISTRMAEHFKSFANMVRFRRDYVSKFPFHKVCKTCWWAARMADDDSDFIY